MKSVLKQSTALLTLIIGCQFATAAHAAGSMTSPPSESIAIQEKPNQPNFGANIDPIWIVFSGIGLKLEYFISDRVSVGVGGILIPSHAVEKSTSSSSTTSTAYDYKYSHYEGLIGSNIMLTGTLGSRGLYINPAIGYQTTAITDFSSSKLTGETSSPMARLTVGYQWILAKSLRLAAGGGLTAYEAKDIIVKDNSGKEVLREKSSSLGGVALDLQVGYVF